MNDSGPVSPMQSSRAGGSEPPTGTVRIEHDRRRLLRMTVASMFAVLTTGGAVVLALLHSAGLSASMAASPGLDAVLPGYTRSMPWWTAIPLGIALLLAIARMLRNLYRLQDADPALVISPRDLRFKPGVFGEAVRVPWESIRDVKTHRFKQQRSIVLQIADVDRYVPRSGLFSPWRRRGVAGPGSGEVSLTMPMSRGALDELAVLLKSHLIRSGRPATPDDTAQTARAKDSPQPPRERAPAV